MHQLIFAVTPSEWLSSTGLEWGIKIVLALVIFIVGRIVANVLTSMILKAFNKAKVDDTLALFLSKIAHVMMLAVVVMAALGKLGVETTSLVAILGAAGLAVGLALQGSLANFAAGVMIIIFRPFKVGDFIEAGGTKGIVESISIFNTNTESILNKQSDIHQAERIDQTA